MALEEQIDLVYIFVLGNIHSSTVEESFFFCTVTRVV